MEPKYPVEPLPHLLLPPDYLHHPLFFDTELRDDSPAITEGRRRHNDPCAAVAADHSYLCRELNFSVQDPNRRESGGRPRTKHRRHSHERSSSRRERNDRRGTPPRSRSRSAAGVKRNGHPTTRSAQLREQYIFQKEMDRLLEAEQAAHDAAADIKPLPPAPAVERVDENMLRPTRAAQLRWDYLAKKRHAAVEVENNIYFVKGQDTSRGAAVQRAAPADPSQSLSSGRLTKAAQLLREHTTRRMKDLEESQQRRRQEEEESDLTFQPALSRRTGGRGSTTTASRSDEPSIVPRPTRAGELRRQHIAEREEAMEKERAVEQAAIDAILKGPRRHRRSTAVPAVDDTSRGKKLSDGQRQGIPVKKERSSRGNERNGATMTAPQRTPMYGTEVGLPTDNKIPT